jgi:hypothetical protein
LRAFRNTYTSTPQSGQRQPSEKLKPQFGHFMSFSPFAYS